MVDLNEIVLNLEAGKARETAALVSKAIEEKQDVKEILETGLMKGMKNIGERFKKNEIFIPGVLIAARAMNMGMKILKPHLVSSGIQPKGIVVIGTVKGDLHDIGKNLVAIMLEGSGFRVIDLGTNVSHERFVEAAGEEKADFIACSALLTTTMLQMKQVVQAVTNAGIRNKVKILIGGAPVTEKYCDSIGADIYAPDAASAVEQAVRLCQ
ncbi:corrinoid protein [Treponema sp. OttesenSCG-928-L16]|nr:corrinoid protein [Treponema sp. OttesenSCG-928-L16]